MTAVEMGIALDVSASHGQPERLTVMAQRAEGAGLELVVLTSDAATDDGSGLDRWTAAAWLAGATRRIGIGIALPDANPPDPADATAAYPSVIAKARDSLDLLAGARVLTDPSAWTVVAPGTSPAEIATLGAEGGPVVVPVSTEAELDALLSRLSTLAPPTPRRSLAARARRAPGIDYDGVPPSLVEGAVEPGDPGYRAVSSTYLRTGAPGLVLRPRSPEQVADALAFARHHRHLPLGIRSAGHGISGRSTNSGGLVVDVSRMNTVEVLDRERRLVRIGPGATWKQIARAIGPLGWAIGSGDYGGVGVGGLATAAGIGYLSRKHGLTIDYLRAVELVLADGSAVRATSQENADLFWAVRGAGANFGVVTSFEFEAAQVGDVGWAKLSFVSTDIATSLLRYGELASTAPRDTTAFLVTGVPRRGSSSITLYAVVDSSDPNVVVERLTPFLEIGDLVGQRVVMTPYAGVMGEAADVGPEGHHGYGEPHSRSAFLPALTTRFATDAAALLESGVAYFFELRAMGGAITDVAPDAAAFSHREPAFQLTVMGGDDAALEAAWAPLRPHVDGLYLSFETGRSEERLLDAFPAPVLRRLRDLKRRYDPDNLFRDNFNIDPDTSAATPQEAIA
ncbi:FAD-binding protein [Blastococcus sp. SYSU DS0617]